MLPVSEINALIDALKRADELISQQESRLEFLEDSGEDVTSYKVNLAAAIEKRNRMEAALQRQVEIVSQSKASTVSGKSKKD